jgi:hypothetical protein
MRFSQDDDPAGLASLSRGRARAWRVPTCLDGDESRCALDDASSVAKMRRIIVPTAGTPPPLTPADADAPMMLRTNFF